jgi:hypothetical protein
MSRELHMGSVKCKIETYKQNWINHLDKMPDERISTQVIIHKHTESSDRERPWKRRN